MVNYSIIRLQFFFCQNAAIYTYSLYSIEKWGRMKYSLQKLVPVLGFLSHFGAIIAKLERGLDFEFKLRVLFVICILYVSVRYQKMFIVSFFSKKRPPPKSKAGSQWHWRRARVALYWSHVKRPEWKIFHQDDGALYEQLVSGDGGGWERRRRAWRWPALAHTLNSDVIYKWPFTNSIFCRLFLKEKPESVILTSVLLLLFQPCFGSNPGFMAAAAAAAAMAGFTGSPPTASSTTNPLLSPSFGHQSRVSCVKKNPLSV